MSTAYLARFPYPYLLAARAGDTYAPAGLDLLPFYNEDAVQTTHLYAIQADAPIGSMKFGLAADPKDRLKTLQQGNDRALTLIAAVPCVAALERAVHSHLAAHRSMGEWFSPVPAVLAMAAGLFEIQLVIEDYQEELPDFDFHDLAAMIAGWRDPYRTLAA